MTHPSLPDPNWFLLFPGLVSSYWVHTPHFLSQKSYSIPTQKDVYAKFRIQIKEFNGNHWRRRKVWTINCLCRKMNPPSIRVEVLHRLDDERFASLSEQKEADMDLRHHTNNVGQERHNTLYEQRWGVEQEQGHIKTSDQGSKGIYKSKRIFFRSLPRIS